ncbi:response regulator [Roseobacter sp.]|uniref:response regulator n=1 Tax=Roseobacter sp. TaxID=1907202 RepID=UPI003296D8D1
MSGHAGIILPVPFISLLVSVVVAGIFGGLVPGLIAGLISTVLIIHSYQLGIGPAELTGNLFHAVVGSVVFTAIGAQLGRVKDQSELTLQKLGLEREGLRASLQRETTAKDRQAQKTTQSQERLKQAVRISGIGHFTWDAATGNCTYCSEQNAAHYGITAEKFIEITGGKAPYTDFVHEDDRDTFTDAIARIDQGESLVFEFRAVQPDGAFKFIRQIVEPVFDKAGQLVEIVGCSLDLTDLREAEARVRQSQRIEVVGTLTGGIAHEFNNLLAITLGHIELALEVDDPTDRHELLSEAIDATYRGAELTKNLLSFAGKAHLEPTRLNLNSHIQDSIAWGLRILPKNVALKNTLSPDLWDTELDTASLDTAIINLLLNARDVMPTGGTIAIETDNMTVEPDHTLVHHGKLSPGNYVVLSVTDTGHGLKAHQLDTIFEPFYSDKPVGMGSGLGLSMVHGFMKQSGGAVHVASEVGLGATFQLYFKALNTPAHSHYPDGAKHKIDITAQATVMIVDDEPAIVRILQRTLEGAGYNVVAAESGDEALVISETLGTLDVLLTDVSMPGTLQGPSLASKMRMARPDLPCIFLTGHSAKYEGETTSLGAPNIRLTKPVGQVEILRTVAQVLGRDHPYPKETIMDGAPQQHP